MQNVKILVIFAMVTSFIGLNASENNFQECLRLKERLVDSLIYIDLNNRDSYMNENNSLYSNAFCACSRAKLGNLNLNKTIFNEELNKDLINEKAKQANCNESRKVFLTALSVSTNDLSTSAIVSLYKSTMVDCK